MNANTNVSVALRPMLPDDGPALAAIFRTSIEVLAEDDYSENQREAWAARADDEAAFAKKLAGSLTLVATVDSEPVGFAALEGADKIAMLYVRPDMARQRVASTLCDALERLSAARKVAKLTVDASDSAREFFIGRGYMPMVRNMVVIDDEWLGNTTMERKFAANEPLAANEPETAPR